MGSRVGEFCYATNADAADAWFSGKDASFVVGSTSYLGWFEKVSSTWVLKRQSIDVNGTVTVLGSIQATVPAFPVCSPMDNFNDGLLIGWGVAAAMLAAYAVKFIAKGLNRDSDS